MILPWLSPFTPWISPHRQENLVLLERSIILFLGISVGYFIVNTIFHVYTNQFGVLSDRIPVARLSAEIFCSKPLWNPYKFGKSMIFRFFMGFMKVSSKISRRSSALREFCLTVLRIGSYKREKSCLRRNTQPKSPKIKWLNAEANLKHRFC